MTGFPGRGGDVSRIGPDPPAGYAVGNAGLHGRRRPRGLAGGRGPNTLRGYAFDVADFAKFAKLKTADAAVEHLLSAGPAWGTGSSCPITPISSAASSHRRRSPDDSPRSARSSSWPAARPHHVALDVKAPKTKAYRDTRGPGLDGWRRVRAKAGQLADQGVDGKRNLAIVRLLHDLGLRRGEAVAMDLDDVDLDAGKCGEIRIVGKGKLEPERMSLNAPTREALRAWIVARGRKAGPLFIRLDPAASAGGLERLSGDAVERVVKRLSRRAG